MTKTPVQMAVEALECYIEHNEPNDCPCAVMWPHPQLKDLGELT